MIIIDKLIFKIVLVKKIKVPFKAADYLSQINPKSKTEILKSKIKTLKMKTIIYKFKINLRTFKTNPNH